MPAFGGKGRGGKLKFDSNRQVYAAGTTEEKLEAKLRAEKVEKHINYTPRQRYPKIPIPVSPAPTHREQEIIAKYKDNQKRVREGPLYVRRVADANARVNKSGTSGSGLNGFNALPTWTGRYERKYQARPNLEGKLWLKEFLPKELWDVVDPALREKKTNPANDPVVKSRFNINDFSDNEEVEIDENEQDSDAEADAEAADVDEDWVDDEDDDDENDYNGEQYFDNGADDDAPEDDVEPGDDYGTGPNHEEREFRPGEEFDVDG